MKVVVKRQYMEYVEHIEFPVILYIYETGKIIAVNACAKEILGNDIKNMNLIWEGGKKKKFSKKTLNYGSELLYNEGLYSPNGLLEVDIEVNALIMDQVHILVCFFEQSYKQQFLKYSRIQAPRLYIKDKNLNFLGTNRYFLEDAGKATSFSFYGTCNEQYLSREVCDIINESEKIVMEHAECTYSMVQNVKICTVKDYFAKMSRIPLINKNGTCIGMMGIYTLLLNKEEEKKIFDAILRENNLLNECISRDNMILLSLREEENDFLVEYISPNFRKYGFNLDDFYSGRLRWRDIVQKEDREKIEKIYRLTRKKKLAYLVQEYQIIKPDGDFIWVRDETMNIISSGKKYYWNSRICDITEEKWKEDKQTLETYLRKAVMSGCTEFRIFYQPIVDSVTKKIVGAEALLRWQSKELGLIDPVEFISITEYMGLIVPLGEFVIRKVFIESKKWNHKLKEKILFHINLSVVQLLQPDIIRRILYLAGEQQVDFSSIVFEVTESLAIEDMTLMKKVLDDLKKHGFQIAMDDFGTGYSSLNYIMEMPLDYIKIDKTFIEKYGAPEFNPTLISAMTELVHSMNMQIIIEGVETKQQIEFLTFMNIDKYQGYLYGKPMESEQFHQLYVRNLEQKGEIKNEY